MRIWVTGGQGLLGIDLIKLLRQESKDSQIFAPTRSELDLSSAAETLNFVRSTRPTHVYHLAATVMGLGGHSRYPEKARTDNILIDANVFQALKLYPAKWIYYASSVAAYGYPYNSLPLKEDDWLNGDPHESELGYALAKRSAKSQLDELQFETEVSFVYGLCTNLFGENDRFQNGNGHVIVSLLNKAHISKRDGTIFRPWGTQDISRDFIHSSDAAKYLVSLLGIDAGVINIASGREVSLGIIVDTIVKEINLENRFEFTGEHQGILNRVCNVTKLSNIIGTQTSTLIPVEHYVKKYFANRL